MAKWRKWRKWRHGSSLTDFELGAFVDHVISTGQWLFSFVVGARMDRKGGLVHV